MSLENCRGILSSRGSVSRGGTEGKGGGLGQEGTLFWVHLLLPATLGGDTHVISSYPLEHREGKPLTQGHTASKWQNWDLNLDVLPL